MSYIKAQYAAPINGQSAFLIPKDNVAFIVPGAGALTTTVDLFLKQVGPVGAAVDAYRITFSAAAAAGFSLCDAVSNAWASSPGGISLIGGIPATLSATGQALTFVTITSVTLV